jgi:carbon monoxide dehydrogenase subunit G
MELAHTIEIGALPEAVWKVLIDVERWPEWTASVNKVTRVDKSSFGLGSQARIEQPKLAKTVWTVTRFERAKSFDWESRTTGSHTIAGHSIEPSVGGSKVTLTVRVSGWAAKLLQGFIKPLTERYMAMEAEGLKKVCERQ